MSILGLRLWYGSAGTAVIWFHWRNPLGARGVARWLPGIAEAAKAHEALRTVGREAFATIHFCL
jgi:hypothetical protein